MSGELNIDTKTPTMFLSGDRQINGPLSLLCPILTMGYGSTHLGRVVGEDEEEEDVDNDADARDEIVGFLGDEEDVNEHVDEDCQEEDDGEDPEDTRFNQLHWCR